MNFKKPASVTAAVMLGLSTVMVPPFAPVATAQTASDPLPQETIKIGTKTWNLARYSDGRIVLLADSPNVVGSQTEGTPTYRYSGENYQMELVSAGTNRTVGGEQLYYWKVVSKVGQRSTNFREVWFSESVNDYGLYDTSNNGMLYRIVPTPGSGVNGTMEHFANNWRGQFNSAVTLYNLVISFTSQGTLTPAGTNGQAGVLVYNAEAAGPNGEIAGKNHYHTNTLTANDPFTTGRNEELASEVLVSGWRPAGNNPLVKNGELIIPDSLEQIVPGEWEAKFERFPGGHHTVIQMGEDVPVGQTSEGQYTIAFDKFYFEPTTVTQGGNKTVTPPVPDEGEEPGWKMPEGFDNFTPVDGEDGTPEWITVNEDGSLELKPGFDIPADTYRVPVQVNFTDRPSDIIYIDVTVEEAVGEEDGPLPSDPGSSDGSVGSGSSGSVDGSLPLVGGSLIVGGLIGSLVGSSANGSSGGSSDGSSGPAPAPAPAPSPGEGGSPAPETPGDPAQPGAPAQPADPADGQTQQPGQQTQQTQPAQQAPKGERGVSLANTGANVAGLAIAGALLAALGALLIGRRRKA